MNASDQQDLLYDLARQVSGEIRFDKLSRLLYSTDASIYRCTLDSGREVIHEAVNGRRIFLYLTAGQILVNDARVNEKDQARIDTEEPLTKSSSLSRI